MFFTPQRSPLQSFIVFEEFYFLTVQLYFSTFFKFKQRIFNFVKLYGYYLVFWFLIFVKFVNFVLCSLSVIIIHFFKGYCLNDKIKDIVVFVGFIVFLINVLQSICFFLNIPFFVAIDLELNIFSTINMQFFYFAVCLHHHHVACNFEVIGKKLSYLVFNFLS
jgi:hypothetical protein